MVRKFIGCFILLLVVFAVTDKRNATPAGLVPLVVFLTILGIVTSFGMQTGTFLLSFISSILTETLL